MPEESEVDVRWQRWDLSIELSMNRRFGEVSAALKVPKNYTLRCYVIPVSLLDYRDILAMVEAIEEELQFTIAWSTTEDESNRSWSHLSLKSRSTIPSQILKQIEEEIRAADLIRRDPFKELGPMSRSGMPLAENALVSQWAVKRSNHIRNLIRNLQASLEAVEDRGAIKNPKKRQEELDLDRDRLRFTLRRSLSLRGRLATFIDEAELGGVMQLSPLFQRDYRLRLLLRAFAPNSSETISEIEALRSSYPPISLINLWELWGMVWIAKELRKLGFSGVCSVESVETVKRCSWNLKNGEIIIHLDFEAEPAFVDYKNMPPLHERSIPALEWAAHHQKINSERPFLGLEIKCSPDYLIRISTPNKNMLLVGDAALSDPKYHRGIENKSTKLHVVEAYRRTIGWVCDGDLIRCHPMGAFVILPPPAEAWIEFEVMEGASDCMLLCPKPHDDVEAGLRLKTLLEAIVPEIGF